MVRIATANKQVTTTEVVDIDVPSPRAHAQVLLLSGARQPCLEDDLWKTTSEAAFETRMVRSGSTELACAMIAWFEITSGFSGMTMRSRA